MPWGLTEVEGDFLPPLVYSNGKSVRAVNFYVDMRSASFVGG